MPNGSDRITSHPLQELEPTKTIDDPEIKAWLALGTKTKKKGGGKKKKGILALTKDRIAPHEIALVLHTFLFSKDTPYLLLMLFYFFYEWQIVYSFCLVLYTTIQ